MGLRDRLLNIMVQRRPDFVIGGDERPYLLRWWVIPRNRFFNVYLHLFLRSDDDRALHDHPWLFNCSILLEGSYREWVPGAEADGIRCNVGILRTQGNWYFRPHKAPHRVELIGGHPCTTLFITGPVVREWGFYCPKGWIPWQRFTASRNKGEVGAGCEG